MPSPTPAHVNGTTLAYERRGGGPPLLLIHGAGESAATLRPQAEALAASGFDVVSYDRRGTGGSGREDWPGRGASQHAADAAALLAELDLTDVVVVGVSSGGVIALELVAHHGERVGRVLAWEPPAVGVIDGGAEISAAMMAPVEQHLVEHPGDYIGAQALLLTQIVGFPVSPDDPAFAGEREHAETMVRDDPAITAATFDASDVSGRNVTIAIGSSPNDVVAATGEVLAELVGRPIVRVEGEHEVYLRDTSVLAELVRDVVSGR